jgi:hypothetical protein
MGHQPEPTWYGADLGSERPTHTSYDGWNDHNYLILRNPWEHPVSQPAPQYIEEEWPQGNEEQWQHKPYSQSARHSFDPHGASSSSAHQGHHH